MGDFFKTSLGRLRAIGWVEGVSFLLILGITMPLKYWANLPGPNKVVGMVHGGLFIAYVWAVVQVAVELGWGWQKTALALLASIVPFGTFWADAKLFKPAPTRP
jgi:integral membrane protein